MMLNEALEFIIIRNYKKTLTPKSNIFKRIGLRELAISRVESYHLTSSSKTLKITYMYTIIQCYQILITQLLTSLR